MNKIPLLAVLKLINKMIKVDTITVSGKDGYKWSFKMDEINKLKQMTTTFVIAMIIVYVLTFKLIKTMLKLISK